MSLLDGFADLNKVEAYGALIPENTYQFVVSEAGVRENTNFKNNEFYIKYLLNDGGKDRQWTETFRLPDSPDIRDWEDSVKKAMSSLKTRLLSLGLSNTEAASPTAERLEGLEGVLQVTHYESPNGRTYVNFRSIKVDKDAAATPTQAPRARKKAAAPVEEAPAAPARRARKPKPAPEPVEDDEYDDDGEDVADGLTVDEATGEVTERPAVLDEDDAVLKRMAARRGRRRAAAPAADNPFDEDDEDDED